MKRKNKRRISRTAIRNLRGSLLGNLSTGKGTIRAGENV